MKNLTDLIVDAAKNSALGEEFSKMVEAGDHTAVSSWLKDKGYDVHEDECKKLTEASKSKESTKLGWLY